MPKSKSRTRNLTSNHLSPLEPIPDPALVVLVGPSASGKTTWANENFRPEEIISSDRLRAIVGSGEHDLDASADAFSILDQMVAARMRRRLLTVVDTLGFDDERRLRHLAQAREQGLPAILVVFDLPAEAARDRNRHRIRPVPAAVLNAQLRRFRQIRSRLPGEGWIIRTADQVVAVNVDTKIGANASTPSQDRSQTLRIFLHLARFNGAGDVRDHLLSMSEAAEDAGFFGISLMDHLTQIPQVGRAWEDFPEAYSSLAFLAGRTTRVRLGALVTNVGLRNPALLAKMMATIDVLSNGRTFCGLGAGWYDAELVAFGYEFESAGSRLDRLEDALRILPLMWGPGKATHRGERHSVADAASYPRPKGSLPIIVGGHGKRTIELAGKYADGLNLVGATDLDRCTQLFRQSAEEAGRDPDALEVSVLDTPLLGLDRADVAALVEANRGRTDANGFRARHNAGTAGDHIDRLGRLGASGVNAVYVSPVGLNTPDDVAAWKPVIDAFK